MPAPSPYGNSDLTSILRALQGPTFTSETIPHGVPAQDTLANFYNWLRSPPPEDVQRVARAQWNEMNMDERRGAKANVGYDRPGQATTDGAIGPIAPLDYRGVEADPGIGQGTLAMLPDPNQAAFMQNQQQAAARQVAQAPGAQGGRALPQAHYDALVRAIAADPHSFLQRLGINRGTR